MSIAETRPILAAPMSFTGSYQRTMKLLWDNANPVVRAAISWWAIPIILMMWWTACLVWYCLFGLLLVPYRLLRRGSRKRKRQEQMHLETVQAIKDQASK